MQGILFSVYQDNNTEWRKNFYVSIFIFAVGGPFLNTEENTKNKSLQIFFFKVINVCNKRWNLFFNKKKDMIKIFIFPRNKNPMVFFSGYN